MTGLSACGISIFLSAGGVRSVQHHTHQWVATNMPPISEYQQHLLLNTGNWCSYRTQEVHHTVHTPLQTAIIPAPNYNTVSLFLPYKEDSTHGSRWGLKAWTWYNIQWPPYFHMLGDNDVHQCTIASKVYFPHKIVYNYSFTNTSKPYYSVLSIIWDNGGEGKCMDKRNAHDPKHILYWATNKK